MKRFPYSDVYVGAITGLFLYHAFKDDLPPRVYGPLTKEFERKYTYTGTLDDLADAKLHIARRNVLMQRWVSPLHDVDVVYDVHKDPDNETCVVTSTVSGKRRF